LLFQPANWDDEIEKQLFPYSFEPFNIWLNKLFWYSYSDAEDVEYKGLKNKIKSVLKRFI